MIDRYENVKTDLIDGVLTIRCVVDPEQVDIQPSKSGKTDVIATTGGAQLVPGSGGLKINLTVYRAR